MCELRPDAGNQGGKMSERRIQACERRPDVVAAAAAAAFVVVGISVWAWHTSRLHFLREHWRALNLACW